MPRLEESLTIIEKWKKKSSELSTERKDDLFAAATKGFEAMIVMISKESNHKDIQRALTYLNAERSLSLQFEKNQDDSTRDIMHGLLESIQLTLAELSEGKNRVKEIGEMFTQTDEISSSVPMNPMDNTQAIPDDNQFPLFDFGEEEKKFKEEIMEDDLKVEMEDPEKGVENPFNDQLSFTGPVDMNVGCRLNSSVIRNNNMRKDNSLNDLSTGMEDMNEAALSEIDHRDSLMKDKLEEDGETLNDTTGTMKDSSGNAEVEKERRKSSRNTSKNLKFAEHSEDSDDDSTPLMKKSRPNSTEKKISKRRSTEDTSKSGSNKSQVSKRNDTEMECPECEYRTHTVKTWLSHLSRQHSTNPSLTGLALRCECGHECLSEKHSYSCNIANFMVIRKRDGPIRRLNDEKTTPQCDLCKVYPSTVYGYINHLRVHHNKSTLRSTGNYILCACGVKFTYYDNKIIADHRKKCDGRDFAVHKLSED